MKREPYDTVEVPYYAFTALMALAKATEEYLEHLVGSEMLSQREAERAEVIIRLARKLQEGELHDS